MKDLMDIFMTYHLSSDIVLPYYDYSFKEKLLDSPAEKRKDICMFVSSPVNKSRRIEYLSELSKELEIDSYGMFMNNCKIKEDMGYTSKLETIKNYKFTIAFENAISEDYVTEKFFDPLTMGSVPVYLGATSTFYCLANIYKPIVYRVEKYQNRWINNALTSVFCRTLHSFFLRQIYNDIN